MSRHSHIRELTVEGGLRKVIKQAIKDLKPYIKEFDAIAVRGFSGTVPGAILAHHFNKNLLIVRKEKAHRDGVEGENCKKYLIIDDFVSTGKTLRDIVSEIHKMRDSFGWPTPYAIYLWRDAGTRDGYKFEHYPGNVPLIPKGKTR